MPLTIWPLKLNFMLQITSKNCRNSKKTLGKQKHAWPKTWKHLACYIHKGMDDLRMEGSGDDFEGFPTDWEPYLREDITGAPGGQPLAPPLFIRMTKGHNYHPKMQCYPVPLTLRYV